ncbi:dialkylglycine decarboxylase [Cylindrobasidium torrendii FP15055 ss-10]|uniref:Dialkylglycine decarboxylase n=1 Tax=Cylindrobasidium torrendii FP15055 ss-10 TaxID=1314674 RepID=A0A0D7BF20_9AGAR|nr:dialkylglycine decarboxylase [Cylindrobasidium torrendii FP15055 ss-10]
MTSQANQDPAFWSAADNSLIRYGGAFVPRIIESAEGVYLHDAEGNKIIDFTSGQMSSILGHGHPEIVNVIIEHAKNLDHLFSGMITRPVIDLASKLTGMMPKGLDKVMFLSTGGESNEAAIRMAKLYTGRYEIVGLTNSWHGVTQAAISATFQPTRKNYGPSAVGSLVLPAPNAYRSPFRKPDGSYDWEAELDYGWNLVDSLSTGNLAAVILEPILSSGGVIVPPPGYLRRMKEHCAKRGALLILDEAQTGMGRTGKMFAFEHEGMVPDILTLSKTLGAGLPLSAVVTSTEIEETVYKRGYSFYTTHISDPLPAAVGSKVVDIVVRDDLPARAHHLGNVFRSFLLDLQKKYPCIGEVRGQGLLVGMEIVKDQKTREADEPLGIALADRMLELGLSANVVRGPGFGACFRMAPSLNITEDQLKEGLEIIAEAFRTTPGVKTVE